MIPVDAAEPVRPTLRQRLEPALRKLIHLYFRVARGMTLGVRAVVIDADNRVFLVRHTYVSGWYLPGGGVEVGQTFRQALDMELREEGLIALTGEPLLHGIYLNSHVSVRDHVAVYVVRHFHQERMPAPNREIAECGFFALDALPGDTTEGTQLRLAELFEGRPISTTWRV
jgi:ADP-ribose pyrophosphatase YjhB (NUDIX family)